MNLTLQTIASPIVSELLANTKVDGVVLDTEHGVFNNETLSSCIQTITLLNKKCFVRVTCLDKRLVRMCLDSGCDGIIFSTIESEEQASEIISYCQYPTYNGKRGCGLVRENDWGNESLGKKIPTIIAQIETKKGVDNLDSLMKYDFDYYFIGPYDLSSSLGCPGDWDNELYIRYINKIYDKIDLSNMGMFLVTSDDIDSFHNGDTEKPKIVVWGMDAIYIRESMTQMGF